MLREHESFYSIISSRTSRDETGHEHVYPAQPHPDEPDDAEAPNGTGTTRIHGNHPGHDAGWELGQEEEEEAEHHHHHRRGPKWHDQDDPKTRSPEQLRSKRISDTWSRLHWPHWLHPVSGTDLHQEQAGPGSLAEAGSQDERRSMTSTVALSVKQLTSEVILKAFQNSFSCKRRRASPTSGFGSPGHSNSIMSMQAMNCLVLVWATLISILLFFIPISMVIMGVIFYKACPVNHMIPVYLLVAGVVSVVLRVENMASHRHLTQDELEDNSRRILSPLEVLGVSFLAGWFFAGCYFIYSTKGHFQSQDSSKGDYCNPVLYYYAFSLVTFHFIFVFFYFLAALTLVCLMAMCRSNDHNK